MDANVGREARRLLDERHFAAGAGTSVRSRTQSTSRAAGLPLDAHWYCVQRSHPFATHRWPALGYAATFSRGQARACAPRTCTRPAVIEGVPHAAVARMIADAERAEKAEQKNGAKRGLMVRISRSPRTIVEHARCGTDAAPMRGACSRLRVGLPAHDALEDP